MNYNEVYEYKLTRTYEDGSTETVHMVIPNEKALFTHDNLATKFNQWLDSCSFIGHNYVNHRDR